MESHLYVHVDSMASRGGGRQGSPQDEVALPASSAGRLTFRLKAEVASLCPFVAMPLKFLVLSFNLFDKPR